MAPRVVKVEYPNGMSGDARIISDDEIDVSGPVAIALEVRDVLVVDGERRTVEGIKLFLGPGETEAGPAPSARLRLNFPTLHPLFTPGLKPDPH